MNNNFIKQFTRTIENFTCLHCGLDVVGNGYTNHCPRCLWSRHVDVNPGDRQNICEGAMAPLRLEMEKGEFAIIHRCQTCGAETKVKTQPEDDIQILLKTKEE